MTVRLLLLGARQPLRGVSAAGLPLSLPLNWEEDRRTVPYAEPAQGVRKKMCACQTVKCGKAFSLLLENRKQSTGENGLSTAFLWITRQTPCPRGLRRASTPPGDVDGRGTKPPSLAFPRPKAALFPRHSPRIFRRFPGPAAPYSRF